MIANDYIIIVTHNHKQPVTHLLSILGNLASASCKIVIVDNGSTDGTQAVAQQFEKYVLLIQNKANIGFVKAANIGISFAMQNRADSVLLLSPTLKYFDETSFMVLKAKKADIVGPVFLHSSFKSKEYAYAPVIMPLTAQPMFHWQKRRPPISYNATPHFVSRRAMLIKASAILKIGLLDERFLTYYADIDYCLRAKAAGLRLAIEPKAIFELNEKPLWQSDTKQLFRDYSIYRQGVVPSQLIVVAKLFRYLPVAWRKTAV